MNPYESRRYLDEYLLFHFGRVGEVCPFKFVPAKLVRFHERIRRECLLPVRLKTGPTRALDLGCGVGRFTFELGRVVDEVLGIDNSRGFIRAAREMARKGAVRVRILDSGDTFSERVLRLPASLQRGSVRFQTGDAMDLGKLRARSFHIVAAINLLCRLPRPRAFLRQLPRLVAPGGQLVLASPYSWLPEFTPRQEWLDAREVELALRPEFRLARRHELPFLIREHRRKYQLVVSAIAVYVRNK